MAKIIDETGQASPELLAALTKIGENVEELVRDSFAELTGAGHSPATAFMFLEQIFRACANECTVKKQLAAGKATEARGDFSSIPGG